MHTEISAPTLITIPAHFDGEHIRLDADVQIEPNTRLLITVLSAAPDDAGLVWSAMRQSEPAFARVWDNNEDAVYDHL